MPTKDATTTSGFTRAAASVQLHVQPMEEVGPWNTALETHTPHIYVPEHKE